MFHNHCDRVRMANLAQCVNVLQSVILTNKEKIVLTPTYHVMEMYNVHQNALMLPVTVQSNEYILGDKKLKAISASASKDKNGYIHISLVNIDAKKGQEIKIELGDFSTHNIKGLILSAKNLQDYNSFDFPDKIKPEVFTDTKIDGNILTAKLPPFSVVVLELK